VLKEIKISKHKFALNEPVTPLGPTSNRYYYSKFNYMKCNLWAKEKGDEIPHLIWIWVLPLEKKIK